jgi:hypothetical protein
LEFAGFVLTLTSDIHRPPVEANLDFLLFQALRTESVRLKYPPLRLQYPEVSTNNPKVQEQPALGTAADSERSTDIVAMTLDGARSQDKIRELGLDVPFSSSRTWAAVRPVA